MEAEASEKRRLTVDWLHRHYLSTMEFMPNENRIVLCGVGTITVHKELYQTSARSGGFYLSYKQFMACMKPAAVACVAAQHGASEDKKHKVRVSHAPLATPTFPCAPHATIPSRPTSRRVRTPWQIRKMWQRPKRRCWTTKGSSPQTGRAREACDMRPTTLSVAPILYECDDKCGSFSRLSSPQRRW